MRCHGAGGGAQPINTIRFCLFGTTGVSHLTSSYGLNPCPDEMGGVKLRAYHINKENIGTGLVVQSFNPSTWAELKPAWLTCTG